MVNLLKKLFYAPNYISMPAAGVAVFNRSINYMEFFNKKGLIFIKNFGEVPLAPNIIKDGEILDKDAFEKALSFIKTKISSDFVRVSIPEQSTYTFDTQIPNIKDSDMRAALEFKLEENVPLKADEVFFEYEIIKNNKKLPSQNSNDISVSVSVIPKKIIKSFSEAFDSVSLHPVSFEVQSKMTAKALIAKKDVRNFMIINIKGDSTTISFVVNGTVRFTSTIPIGDKNLMEILEKDVLTKDSKTPDGEDQYAMFNIFSIMKDEVEKFYEYIISKSKDKSTVLPSTVDQIILCGKSATLPGFVNHITQDIDIEVVFGNVWTNVFYANDYLPTLKFEDSLNFATSIGLALPNNKR